LVKLHCKRNQTSGYYADLQKHQGKYSKSLKSLPVFGKEYWRPDSGHMSWEKHIRWTNSLYFQLHIVSRHNVRKQKLHLALASRKISSRTTGPGQVAKSEVVLIGDTIPTLFADSCSSLILEKWNPSNLKDLHTLYH
jgi:hypothetical protein